MKREHFCWWKHCNSTLATWIRMEATISLVKSYNHQSTNTEFISCTCTRFIFWQLSMILGIWAGLFWVQVKIGHKLLQYSFQNSIFFQRISWLMRKTVQAQRAGPLGPNLALQASSLTGGWEFAAGLKLVCNWLFADLFPGPFHWAKVKTEQFSIWVWS